MLRMKKTASFFYCTNVRPELGKRKGYRKKKHEHPLQEVVEGVQFISKMREVCGCFVSKAAQ